MRRRRKFGRNSQVKLVQVRTNPYFVVRGIPLEGIRSRIFAIVNKYTDAKSTPSDQILHYIVVYEKTKQMA